VVHEVKRSLSKLFLFYRCDKLFWSRSVHQIHASDFSTSTRHFEDQPPTATKLLVSPHAVTMSLPYQSAARSCVRSLRSSPSLRISAAGIVRRRDTETRRWASTETTASNPKISGIVDQISQLTLLETADLVASLKVCHIISLLSSGKAPSS
jgi:hypothetical protein